MFTALLDTCVLWPSLQRDFLLSLAIEGIYRPAWSWMILDELRYGETQKLVSRGVTEPEAERRAERLVSTMRTAFSDAAVRDWEALDGTYGLPDRDDEHVVAAAVVGGANAIVTHNLKDFPADLVPPSIKVLPPAQFAMGAVTVDPIAGMRAIREIASRSGRRGRDLSVTEVLALLVRRYHMDEAVSVLREAIRSQDGD